MVIPEEYGGEDMGWLAAMIVTEEIAKASSSLRVQVNDLQAVYGNHQIRGRLLYDYKGNILKEELKRS